MVGEVFRSLGGSGNLSVNWYFGAKAYICTVKTVSTSSWRHFPEAWRRYSLLTILLMLDDVKVRIAESAREIGGAQVQIMGNPRSVADARDSGEGSGPVWVFFARAFRHCCQHLSVGRAIHFCSTLSALVSACQMELFHVAARCTLYLVGLL